MRSILYICGSMNQTTQMHAIAQQLPEYRHSFTPFYGTGFIGLCAKLGLLEFSILGKRLGNRALAYMREHGLHIDEHGLQGPYDLVLTCTDLVVPRNILNSKIMLIQEGMTDPENLLYYIVKHLRLPRWLASTSTTGLSHVYDKFCVASEGYRRHFLRKGVRPETLVVTGIPNFDNCAAFLENHFPHRGYVLVATSDMRETFKYENRKGFIRRCQTIAGDRQLIFKLHPNENAARAKREINELAPYALVFSDGRIEHMIANCVALITRFSSVVYIGIALGKEVYSDFNLDELRDMAPLQNAGTSSLAIADECRNLLEIEDAPIVRARRATWPIARIPRSLRPTLVQPLIRGRE